MAEGRGELEVYNHWFAAADLDRDGVLGGAEAVAFFQRSGLPQNPTLFKVREPGETTRSNRGAAAAKRLSSVVRVGSRRMKRPVVRWTSLQHQTPVCKAPSSAWVEPATDQEINVPVR